VHQPKDASEVFRPQDAGLLRKPQQGTGPVAMPAAGRREPPRDRGRKGNLVKSILGAVIIGADIIAGMATPAIMAGLHKPHPHLTGPITLYTVLGLATLWVVMSLLGSAKGSGETPAPRPRYSFGGRGR